ncbi:adhesive plaque matrix protein-like [Episyrphus balteatus]|uniref:adhesive plaque matrix protein-like n=1 Tax=Episyrphus balteatus TaxID=286459 RepID=UPI002484FE69|nr:adhesive plaque matrix protein-like [Episyrphus balteatus]
MLIRMFLDNIILSVVLLAGISLCTAEEDGYDYSRPAIGFSDGFGSQSQYVVSSTTPKPVAVYTVKPQASQYKAPTVSSSFAQSSTSFSRPASSVSQFGQYQTTQKYQAPIVSTVAKSQATSGQYVSGQYKAPVIAVTPKPQTSFGAFQGFSQSSSKTGSGQYKAPVVAVTSKPQTNFGAFQGFSQASSKTGSGQYVSGQYKAPVIAVTSKPQTSFGAFQGFGQSVTSKPQTSFGAFQGFGQSTNKVSASSGFAQYKPAVSNVAKPSFGGFQGFSQSSQSSSYSKPITTPKPIAKPAVTEYYSASSTASPVTAKPYVSSTSKPLVITPKPQTSFSAFQGFGQSKPAAPAFSQYGQQSSKPAVVTGQYQKPLVVVTPKPQTSAFQGFGQKVNQVGQYQKPSTGYSQSSSSFSQYQKPVVTSKPFTSFGNTGPSYLPPSKPQVSTIKVQPTVKPAVSQYNFQSASSTVAPAVVKPLPTLPTPKPVIVTSKPQTVYNTFQGSVSKPQTSFNSFQGFGQSKPAVVQYQKPVVSTPIKSQSTFGSSQSFSQTSYQKPAVTQTYYKPSTTAKPNLSYLPPKGQAVPAYQAPTVRPVAPKPQAAFSGFGQSVYQKPAVSTLNTFGQQSVTKYTSSPVTVKPVVYTPATFKPVVVTPKPQSASSGFGQSVYQKPAVSNFNTFGQQSVTKYTSSPVTAKPVVYTPATFKPVVVTPKPQPAFTGFGQSVYQKPAVSTFNTFGQQSVTKYTSSPVTVKPVVYTPATVKPVVYTPATFKPVVVTPKPQAAFSGFGQSVYQKPAVSTFNTFGQQTATKYTSSPVTVKPVVYTPATVKPVVYTPATFKPVVVTPKPQAAFSGFGQSVYQKPAVSTFNTFGQQAATKYTSSPVTVKPVVYTPATVKPVVYTPATFKPVVVTPKPQAAFSGFGQSVYQKPAVNTFNTFGQQSVTKYTSSPVTVKPVIYTPATFKPVVVTPKPQPAFTGFGQSTYQKPAVSSFNTFSQQTATKYSSSPVTAKPVVYTPATFKPVVVTPKPQPAFTGFGQSVYQKPAVSTFNTFGQQSVTKYTSSPVTVKPVVYTPATVKPVVYTPAPVRPTLSPESLTYLPPKGVSAPLNAASSSGAISQSFFDYASATANQVVDVAQEQKVGGFVADEEAIKSLQSDSSIITNQVSSANTREQKVEGIDLRSSKLTATKQGQEEQEYFSGNFGRNKRQIYSNGGYQVNYPTQTGYLSYQGNPITTQQFGGVQPNSYQGVPYQQIAQAQSVVGIANNGGALYQGNYPAQQGATSYTAPNQDPYNFEGQYGYISSVEDQQQHIPQNYETQAQQQQQIPQNYETAASYTDAVNTQIPNDSPVHDPLPLNREEQQVRQVVEKPDSDFRNLQPGSYVGPHVNKNSDHEYNVFDYDQYSKDPAEDAESLS